MIAQKFLKTIRFIPTEAKGFTAKAAISSYHSHQKIHDQSQNH